MMMRTCQTGSGAGTGGESGTGGTTGAGAASGGTGTKTMMTTG